MLKYEYRILKYIRKNPNITKSEILKKFPDFEKYEAAIRDYVYKEDKNKDIVSDVRDRLLQKVSEMDMPIGEQADYIESHMEGEQNAYINSLIYFSTNRLFELEVERRRRDAWTRWFPYAITTAIAIASIIARFIHA